MAPRDFLNIASLNASSFIFLHSYNTLFSSILNYLQFPELYSFCHFCLTLHKYNISDFFPFYDWDFLVFLVKSYVVVERTGYLLPIAPMTAPLPCY